MRTPGMQVSKKILPTIKWKKQTTETNSEMTQMLQSVGKNIKSYNNMPYV